MVVTNTLFANPRSWNELPEGYKTVLSNGGVTEKIYALSEMARAHNSRNAYWYEDPVTYITLAGGSVLSKGVTQIIKSVVKAEIADCTTDGRCDAAEFIGKIYRNASGTADSLTPRPGVDDVPGSGLSFWNSFDLLKEGKYVIVDTSKLQQLKAVLDNNPAGHIIVSPTTLQELQAWAMSRGTGVVHEFTDELLKAVEFIGKK